jgi:hypothetical protein
MPSDPLLSLMMLRVFAHLQCSMLTPYPRGTILGTQIPIGELNWIAGVVLLMGRKVIFTSHGRNRLKAFGTDRIN